MDWHPFELSQQDMVDIRHGLTALIMDEMDRRSPNEDKITRLRALRLRTRETLQEWERDYGS